VKKKERTRRKNRNKNMYIYLAVAVAIIVIAFSAVINMGPTRVRVAAAEYFETKNGLILDADIERSNNQTLYLLQVRFNLTAVGGDAHRIVITVPGMVPSDEWPDAISKLTQNETRDITLPEFKIAVPCRKNADGYFEFVTSLDCDEATGKIIVLLKE
jgi:hypothetical protein